MDRVENSLHRPMNSRCSCYLQSPSFENESEPFDGGTGTRASLWMERTVNIDTTKMAARWPRGNDAYVLTSAAVSGEPMSFLPISLCNTSG